MASLMPNGKQQYFDPSTGAPLAGGKLFTYVGGTSTPKDTWQDAGATIKNQNPIPLDTTGSAVVFWSGNYKVQLQDSLGNVIYTVDNYSTDSRDHPVQVELQTANAGQTVFTLTQTTYTAGINSLHVYVDGLRVIMPDYAETSSTVVTFASPLAAGQLVMFECGSAANSQSTLDASIIPYTPGGGGSPTNVAAALNGLGSFQQAGTGAVVRTAQSKMRDTIHVRDYGAVGNRIADDTTSVQAALNAAATAGVSVVMADGCRLRLTAKLTIPSNVLFVGARWLPDPSNLNANNQAELYIDWGAGQDNHAVEMSYSSGIEGFTFYYPGQAAVTAATPVTFGYSVSTPLSGSNFDNIHVKNITFYNSYKGLRLNNGGRWHVENIQGNPLAVGFSSDNCYDACYLSKVHFWNFYTQGGTLENWVAANGIAFDLHRIDQLFADSLFGWNYQYCFYCQTNLWASFTNILCDKAQYPFVTNGTSQINVNNFVLIGNASAGPAIWVQSGQSIRFSNGRVTSASSVGAQIDGGTLCQFGAVDFSNQHAAAVVTTLSTDVFFANCQWAIPPFGSYNVRVNGERLPKNSTAITLPTPITTPTTITGGYSFDLSTAGSKTLSWETTYISERNSLYILEFDYQVIGNPTTWYFQFFVQTDTGTNAQVSFAPSYPMILNGGSRKVRIPFFINHGRYRQVMNLVCNPTATTAGASVSVTNIALYEQDNLYTTDTQVSNMMRTGYNLDGYSMGQTLFAKGKNRRVITQSESGIGRSTEVPIAGTWAVGDEVEVYSPTATGPLKYVCTTAGTPGTWTGLTLP